MIPTFNFDISDLKRAKVAGSRRYSLIVIRNSLTAVRSWFGVAVGFELLAMGIMVNDRVHCYWLLAAGYLQCICSISVYYFN